MLNKDPLVFSAQTDYYLGFDFGTKKIGIATGQVVTSIANPLQTLYNIKQKPDWEGISRLISVWHPVGLVVGISRLSDSLDNPVTPRIRKFCRQLNGRYKLPVFQIDETLSTFEAKQILFNDLKVSASKLWKVHDQLAAKIILQSWLNQHATKV